MVPHGQRNTGGQDIHRRYLARAGRRLRRSLCPKSMEKASSGPSRFAYYWEHPSNKGYGLVGLDRLQGPVRCVPDHLLWSVQSYSLGSQEK